MKKSISLFTILAFFLLLASCLQTVCCTEAISKDRSLTVIYTANTNGTIESCG